MIQQKHQVFTIIARSSKKIFTLFSDAAVENRKPTRYKSSDTRYIHRATTRVKKIGKNKRPKIRALVRVLQECPGPGDTEKTIETRKELRKRIIQHARKEVNPLLIRHCSHLNNPRARNSIQDQQQQQLGCAPAASVVLDYSSAIPRTRDGFIVTRP